MVVRLNDKKSLQPLDVQASKSRRVPRTGGIEGANEEFRRHGVRTAAQLLRRLASGM
jgi:hypothetical protein